MQSTRRDLLKVAGLAAAGLARGQESVKTVAEMRFEPKEAMRLGVIGTGGRGSSLVENFSAVPGVAITALCDVVKEKAQRVQARLDRAGKASQKIELYTDGDY